MSIPNAKAMSLVMEVRPGCMEQDSFGTSMSCCFNALPLDQTALIPVAKTGENCKRLVYGSDFVSSAFLSFFDQKTGVDFVYKPTDSKLVHPMLTRIVVKKE